MTRERAEALEAAWRLAGTGGVRVLLAAGEKVRCPACRGRGRREARDGRASWFASCALCCGKGGIQRLASSLILDPPYGGGTVDRIVAVFHRGNVCDPPYGGGTVDRIVAVFHRGNV